MPHYLKNIATCVAVVVGLFVLGAHAAEDEDKKDEKDKKTLAELIKGKTEYPGFINVVRDPGDGSGYLIIDRSQLNKDLLHFAKTVNGAIDAGHFKGFFRESKLIEFRRYFDRIDVIAKTPRYYFDERSAISRSADSNVSEAVLISAKIEAEDDGKLAIKLGDFFLNEQLHKVSPLPDPDPEKEKERFKLGKFTAEKSRIVSIDSFPKNTHVVVDYVFSNDSPIVSGGRELSDPRFVSVTLQHAFIELPENGYRVRRDDPRVGYFTQQFDDLTSERAANYRDVINRWDLQKKNPGAKLSDPVKPIIWWIENTTPVEWRDMIRDAVLAWNPAFEKIGIRNAIEVRIQPDDATWSANDVRYNVLRWVSSPRPPFGGYGPSIANPKTGEIIAADIMLEYVFLKGRLWMAEAYTTGEAAPGFSSARHSHCDIGHGLIAGLGFGQAATLALERGDKEKDMLLRHAMYYLILHEVGHTLGLNHNMRASQLHDNVNVHNASLTQGALTGSVMDYGAVNIAPPGQPQGDYYQHKLGPYDYWVIEYGYSPALSDPVAEEQRLEKILARSTDKTLAFGNDADDMRSPGRHIDPRVNIFDMSSDAVAFARDRFELINTVYGQLKERVLADGESHHDLWMSANLVFAEFGNQANVVSRYIGGIYVDRAFVGQQGATQPYTPVPGAMQERALATLADYVFAPDAVTAMEPLYAHLQMQRRGFDAFGQNEDPKLHTMVLNMQNKVLDHVLHPAVLQRMSDSALYGNTYSLEKMLGDLTDVMFASDLRSDVNSYRRNVQAEYVDRLITISGLEKKSKYDYLSRSAAIYELERIAKYAKSGRGNHATQVHRNYLDDRIGRAFHKSRS